MKLSKPIQADLALIAMTFIWGSTFTVVKQSLTLISPVLFVSIRFWIATVIIAALMPSQIAQINRKSLFQGLVLSFFLLGGFVFQTLGLRNTNPAYSAFITSLSVLLVPLLGYFCFRHRPRSQTIAGVILATLGLYLLLVQMSKMKINSGDVLTLICAVMFAFHIIFLGFFVAKTDYRQLMFLQVAGSAVLCTSLIPFLETPSFVWDSKLILWFFVTGVLATTLAFYVQARAQQYTTANHAALIFSLEPFFAALFAYWILGDMLKTREWVGGILILAGILVSELRIAPRTEPILINGTDAGGSD
jgi:drug/metabolite transporter (DMT)-like permease